MLFYSKITGQDFIKMNHMIHALL